MYPHFQIFGDNVSLFTVMVALGVASLILYTLFLLKKKFKANDNEVVYGMTMLVFALGFGYLGAVLFDAIVKIPDNGKFKIMGMSFYGGLLAAMLTVIVFTRIMKKKTQYSTVTWLNMTTCPLLSFHIFGRLGCFLGGCCYGRETTGVFGLHFPDNVIDGIYHEPGIRLLPTQLFEAIGLLVIMLVIIFFVKKHRFYFYLLMYSVFRFSLEFLRGDYRGYVGIPLSPSQIVSVFLFVVALVLLAKEYYAVFNSKRRKDLK